MDTVRRSPRIVEKEDTETVISAAKILQQMMRESDPEQKPAPTPQLPYGTTEGIENICKVTLTPLVKQIFGNRPVEEWMRETSGTARMIYDLTKGAGPQCIAAGKTVTPGVTPCWLCGLAFPPTDKPVRQLEPICDHVLPVAQGTFFLELYSASKIKAAPLDPTIPRPSPLDKVFTLEYEWAHSICNNVKVDALFMKETTIGENPRWEPDLVSIRNVLNGIWGRTNEAATAIKEFAIDRYLNLNPTYKKIPRTNPDIQTKAKELWLRVQERSIVKRMLEITNFINDDKFGNLRKLAGWASCVDPKNIKRSFLETLSNMIKDDEEEKIEPTVKRKRVGATRRHKKRISGTRRK